MAGSNDRSRVVDTVAWRDRQHAGEVFLVYANVGKTEEWRQEPDRVPLADVVQSLDVFHEGSSSAGPGHASRALLAYEKLPAREEEGGGGRDGGARARARDKRSRVA